MVLLAKMEKKLNMCYGRKIWQVKYEDVSDKYRASAMWKNENKISLAKLPFFLNMEHPV